MHAHMCVRATGRLDQGDAGAINLATSALKTIAGGARLASRCVCKCV